METQAIVQDVYDNFLKITGFTVQEANQNLGNQEFVDQTYPNIDAYIKQKYNIDPARDQEDILYDLDFKIINLYS